MMIYLSKIVLMYSQIIKLLKKSLPTVKTLTGMEWQNVKVKKNYNILVYSFKMAYSQEQPFETNGS